MKPSGFKQHQDEFYPILLGLLAIFAVLYLAVAVWQERKYSNEKNIIIACRNVLCASQELLAVMLSLFTLTGIFLLFKNTHIGLKGYTVITFGALLFWYYVIELKNRWSERKNNIAR